MKFSCLSVRVKICSKVTPLKATYQQVARLTALQQEYRTVSLEFQTG